MRDVEVDVVRARVGDWLPVLPRLKQRQLVGVSGKDVGGLEQERGALGWRAPAPVGLERAVGRLDGSVHLRGPASLDEGYYLAGCRVLDTEPVGFVMGRPPVGAEFGFQGCGHCELSFPERCGRRGGAGSAAEGASASVVSHCCISAISGPVSGVSSAVSLLLSVAAALAIVGSAPAFGLVSR